MWKSKTQLQSLTPTMTTPKTRIVTTGAGQYQKITVASFCCDTDGANSIPSGTSVSHGTFHRAAYPPSRAAPSRSNVHQRDDYSVLAEPRLPRHDYPRHQSGLEESLPIFRDSDHCTGPRVSEAAVPISRRLLQSTAGGDASRADTANVSKGHPAPHESPQGRSRLNRPCYTEEQKLFIMYHRVMKQLSWPEIKRVFAKAFDPRTTDGLTSVCYRVQRSWVMGELSKSESTSAKDRDMIKAKVLNFS